MALTSMGKIALISERIEYAALPLVTVDGNTTYGMAAEALMGGKHIWAKCKVPHYDVYPSAVIVYADRLKQLIIQAFMHPEFTHKDVRVRDARWMFEVPEQTPPT